MTKERRDQDEMDQGSPGNGEDQYRDDDNSRREQNEAGMQSMSGDGRKDGSGDPGSDETDRSGGKGNEDKRGGDRGGQGGGSGKQGTKT